MEEDCWDESTHSARLPPRRYRFHLDYCNDFGPRFSSKNSCKVSRFGLSILVAYQMVRVSTPFGHIDLADQSRGSPQNRLIDPVKSDSLNISLGGIVLRLAHE